MSARRTASMIERQRRSAFQRASARPELRLEASPRTPDGRKVVDQETRRLIDEALARKQGKKP